MNPARTLCPKCQADMPLDAPEALCPACLLDEAAVAESAAPPDTFSTTAPRNLQNRTIHVVLPLDEPPGIPEHLRRIGGYELLEEIATGGMGVVYKARQTQLDRLVAIKMIRGRQALREHDVKRFRTEAEAAAKLKHPNIVGIHEIGEHGGQPYFSMDFIEGQSLAQLIEDRPMEPRRGAQLVRQIAEAIHYAHEQGVLHRDLKPSNVMVDRAGQPHVTDFGLAKLVQSDSDLTQTGAVMGSPCYMSPEQAKGNVNRVTLATDVYSLGAVLYEVLTGHPPFLAATPVETMRQVVEQEPVPLRTANRNLPRVLDTICLKCLQKEPSRRYESASAFAADLGRFLADEPILAHPAGLPEKTVRWCRRNPALASVIGLAALLFVTGLTGIIWQWQRAERNATVAASEKRLAEQRLYAADMSVAVQKWKDSSFSEAKALVDAHRDQPQFHDFVWRYLESRTRGEHLASWTNHQRSIIDIAFSPDAKLLATRDKADLLVVQDVTTGSVRWRQTNVISIAGFVSDGSQLVVGFRFYTLAVLRSIDGAPLQSFPEVGIPVQVLPDGNTVATSSKKFLVKLWDLERGRTTFEMPGSGGINEHDRYSVVRRVAFSPDGKKLLVSADPTGSLVPGFLTVWDLETKKQLAHFTENLICFSSPIFLDDHRVAIGRMDGFVPIWNLRQPEVEPALVPACRSAVLALCSAPEHNLMVTAGSDQTLRLWSPGAETPWKSFWGHDAAIHAVAMARDGSRIASGDERGVVRIWAVPDAPEKNFVVNGAWAVPHNQPCFSSDSRYFAVESLDRRGAPYTPVRDTFTLTTVKTVKEGWTPVYFANHDTELVMGVSSHRRWSLRSDEVIPPVTQFAFGAGTDGIAAKAISKDRHLVAFASQHASIGIYEEGTGKQIFRVDDLPHSITQLLFTPDGKTLITDDRRVISFWDIASGRKTGAIPLEFMPDRGLAIAPDGTTMIGSGRLTGLHVWVPETRRQVHLWPGRWSLASAFSPDGRTMATSWHGRIHLWNREVLQEIGTFDFFERQEAGQMPRIIGVTFSPDGNILAAMTLDGTLRFWRVRDTVEFPHKSDDSPPVRVHPPSGTRTALQSP